MSIFSPSEGVKAAYAAAHRLRASTTDGPFWVYGWLTQVILLVMNVVLIFWFKDRMGVVFILCSMMIGVMRQLHRDMLQRLEGIEEEILQRMEDL